MVLCDTFDFVILTSVAGVDLCFKYTSWKTRVLSDG